LKYRAGWGNPVTKLATSQSNTAASSQNQFFLHARNSTEYFIIENRNRSGRDAALTDSGLAIWHVDELGSNSRPETGPLGRQRFECSLVQADGRDDLGDGANEGDETDLFRAGVNARLGPATNPGSAWFDGTPSGLDLHDIGPAGTAITFGSDVES